MSFPNWLLLLFLYKKKPHNCHSASFGLFLHIISPLGQRYNFINQIIVLFTVTNITFWSCDSYYMHIYIYIPPFAYVVILHITSGYDLISHKTHSTLLINSIRTNKFNWPNWYTRETIWHTIHSDDLGNTRAYESYETINLWSSVSSIAYLFIYAFEYSVMTSTPYNGTIALAWISALRQFTVAYDWIINYAQTHDLIRVLVGLSVYSRH